MIKTFKIVPLAMLLALFGSPLFASEKDHATSPLGILYECANILDNTERLACFDDKVAKIRQAEDNKDIVAIDRETAATLKKESFGFRIPTLPKLAFPKLGSDETKEDTLTAKVASVSTYKRKTVLTLENDQVWQIVNMSGKLPRGDLTIEIKPASFGSYLAKVSSATLTQRGIRVKRVE